MEYIDKLSAVQKEAAVNFNGPALVIAGAGSGKTRVLTCRIAYMIANGVEPSSILALTFTNKAAREMRERIGTVVDKSAARGMWMGTFHSMFSRILREEAEQIGFPKTFTIYETSDSRNLVKTIVKEMNLNDDKYKPKDIFSRISLMKNGLITPQAYINTPTHISDDMKAGRGEFAAIYREYMKRCKANGAMDFDDLLLYTNILFRDKPEVLKKYQQQFKYILVDEYQDTNFSQYLIVRKLAEQNQNVCVVGDDAQSIYSFRGAKIENILRFQKDYPQASIHKLEENYRSTRNIVNAANSVISKNSNQLKKNVFSNRQDGDLIALASSDGDREEAQTIARDIEVRHRKGINYGDIAILYRTNSQSKAFEDQLRVRQIPYKIYGGISFYQRAEIKNIIAYVRLITNTTDDEAIKRIINFPARGIGSTTIERIETQAREKGCSMWSVMTTHNLSEVGLNGGAVKRVSEFCELINRFISYKNDTDIYELVFNLVSQSGIIAMYRDNPAPESQSAFENVEELINSLKQLVEATSQEEDIKLLADTWIQDVTLLTDMDDSKGDVEQKVTLMTIHSAKGLEFDTVYLVGVEDGTFPSQRSVESMEGLEEERRLFYVAVTRAVNYLMISFANSRYKWGSVTPTAPSRFIKEIDSRYVDSPELLNTRGGVYQRDNVNGNDDDDAYRGSRKSDGYQKGSYGNGISSGLKGNSPSARKQMGGASGYYQQQNPITPSGNFKRVASTPSTATNTNQSNGINVTGGLSVGCRVEHDRFGFGVISAIEDYNGESKVTVEFTVSGKKTLLLKFAKLKKLD